jgi:hypothetical protein
VSVLLGGLTVVLAAGALGALLLYGLLSWLLPELGEGELAPDKESVRQDS